MPDPTVHAAHDRLLVAAHAAGDASGPDLERAAALVASCPECARLHRDLRALSAALAETPAPARPRDFRLTDEAAARLSRPTGWRRLLAPFSGARSAVGPLAASLATLGLAGLLLGGGVNLGLGGASSMSAPAPQAAATAAPAAAGGGDNVYGSAAGQGALGAAPAPSAAPSAAAAGTPPTAPVPSAEGAVTGIASAAPSVVPPPPATGPAGSPAVASDKNAPSAGVSAGAPTAAPSGAGEANVAPTRSAATPPATPVAEPPGPGPSPLAVGSALLLAAGIVLGLLRLAARRLA